MASKIKVDTLETGDGTGSIIVNNPATFTGAVTTTTDMVVHAGGSARKMFMGISSDDLAIGNYSGGNTVRNEHLKITSDGRGLSQFTAKAWVNCTDSGSVRDSHNISSVTDVSTGRLQPNFTNNMANTGYAAVASDGGYGMTNSEPHTHAVGYFNVYTYNTTGGFADYQIECVVFGD